MEKENEVRFAYFRDPICELRVVTFAWRLRENTIEYALAVNKVVTSRRNPGIPKRGGIVDQHCKKVARAVAGGRLNSKQKDVVGKEEGVYITKTIVTDFLTKYQKAILLGLGRGIPTQFLVAYDVMKRLVAYDVMKQIESIQSTYRCWTKSLVDNPGNNQHDRNCRCTEIGVDINEQED
jgi:hypothetical protein